MVGGVADFDARYASTLQLVKGDIEQGGQLQVQGTPTFFLNGIRLPGLRPEFLDAAIAIELKTSRRRRQVDAPCRMRPPAGPAAGGRETGERTPGRRCPAGRAAPRRRVQTVSPRTADMLAIETEGLTKDYLVGFWRPRPYRALDGLTLQVAPGEVFGFLGPNGAGKSTAIKLLMQLIFPTSGHGADSRPAGRRRRGASGVIGFLPENP